LKKAGKEALVSELKEKFEKANLGILVHNNGLNVKQVTVLRKKLRGVDSEMKVVKNTLASKASEGTRFEKISEHLQGPVAVTFCYKDPVAPAKVIVDFAEENPALVLKGGIWNQKVISIEELKALSKVPPREVLLARMLGALKAPIGRTVNVLNGVMVKLVNVLKAIEEKKK